MITRERGVADGNPRDETDALPTPAELKAVAHEIRFLGSEGAHPGTDVWNAATPEQVGEARDFTRMLLAHLNETPARVQRLQITRAPPVDLGGVPSAEARNATPRDPFSPRDVPSSDPSSALLPHT